MRRTACVLTLALAFGPAAAVADEPPAATVDIREVRGAEMGSGGNGLLAYTAFHEINETIPQNRFLPSTLIDADDHPEAFTAVSGLGVEMRAWLPPAEANGSQFNPVSTLIENVYYDNWLRNDLGTVEVNPGDHAEFALAHVDADAVLPPDAERGDADGELDWDVAIDTRELWSRFGDDEADLDVLFVRADIVARGGDVDARSGPVDMPPLVIDLPRVYPALARGSGMGLLFYPFTEYVDDFGLEIEPQLGKAVITASVAGYLPEARQHTLENGRVIREWHLPLAVTLLVGRQDVLPAVASMTAPAAARAATTGSAGMVDVPAGGTVEAGTALPATVLAPDEDDEPPAPAATADVADLAAAAAIDRHLAEPVTLELASSGVRAVLDPDYRELGVLALRGAEHADGRWAEAVALPYAVVDGEPVRLDRDRLTDLRVHVRYPVFWQSFGMTALPPPPPAQSVTVGGYFRTPGLYIQAMYDLGDDLRAYVEFWGVPGHGQTTQVTNYVAFRRMSRQSFVATPVHYLEPSQTGEVLFDGEPQSHEFTADRPGELRIGPARITGAMGANRGRFTVLRGSPAALDPGLAPNPAAPLGDGPVALLFRASDPQTMFSYASAVRLFLDPPPPQPPPDPQPPALGTPCGSYHVAGSVDPLTPAGLDVTEAWLDADEGHVYASIRVRDLPAEALAGDSHRYSLHWRAHHLTHYARATLDGDGQWTWDAGYWGLGAFHPLDDDRVAGEVQTGSNGVVRIRLPRDIFAQPLADGALLRDLGAHALLEQTVVPDDGLFEGFSLRHHADAEPTGSSLRFGAGADYRVSPCA